MDVSEFDPEFKVRMHSSAEALSESMAGMSTFLVRHQSVKYIFPVNETNNCSSSIVVGTLNIRITLFYVG